MQKALEEFPIADLEISLPEYISVLGDDIEIKKQISESIKSVEEKYNKVKDVEKICTNLRKTNLYSDVKLELLDASSGKATISLIYSVLYFSSDAIRS